MKQPTSIAIALILFFTQIHTSTRLNFVPPKKNKRLSHAFLKQLVDCFQIKTFVETGTYLGDSTAVAAQLFEKVHTIELSEKLFLDKNRMHNLALSNTCGTETLYCYNNHRLSSLYERKSAHLQPKQIIQISTDTLSNVCAKYGIDTINYLKIDTEGAELFVLQGAQELIHNHTIELIQFEYGGAYKDAGTTLRQVYDLLTQAGYSIYRIVPQGLEYLDAWNDYLECFKYSNYLAVCPDFME